MKKVLILGLTAMLLLTLCGCGTISTTIARIGEKSEIYTEEEIEEAMDVVVNEFRRGFDGCTLIEVGYAGDDTISAQKEWARQYDADECILMICTFETGDVVGPLNPNSTYENYQWVLTRNNGGKWEVKTAGY